MPFSFSSAAGVHVVNGVCSEAITAGIAPRDRIVAIGGMSTSEWMRAGMPGLEEGGEIAVRVSKRDGRNLDARVHTVPHTEAQFPLDRLAMWLIPIVGVVYLVIGLGVWLLKPDRRESWVPA